MTIISYAILALVVLAIIDSLIAIWLVERLRKQVVAMARPQTEFNDAQIRFNLAVRNFLNEEFG